MAPELVVELGGPYERLWKLLSSATANWTPHAFVAKLVGAIVDHGEQQIGQILEQMLATPPQVASQRCAPPATVPMPDVLQPYQVESTPAATYNVLLAGRD